MTSVRGNLGHSCYYACARRADDRFTSWRKGGRESLYPLYRSAPLSTPANHVPVLCCSHTWAKFFTAIYKCFSDWHYRRNGSGSGIADGSWDENDGR
jgi:hypothetical protein